MKEGYEKAQRGWEGEVKRGEILIKKRQSKLQKAIENRDFSMEQVEWYKAKIKSLSETEQV